MESSCDNLVQKLADEHSLSREELTYLINKINERERQRLFDLAAAERDNSYGKRVFMRGLIEFTSYCKNDCLYCGLRRSNPLAERYRLTDDEILHCCEKGYSLGFRTFVLQGGEDPHFTDERVCKLIFAIKSRFPDCAVTLSIGERSADSYKAMRNAGADRYLLRHETADSTHYSLLHPPELSLESRLNCLQELKKIGFQTGCGFMVGSPFQTTENLVTDLLFIKEFQPEMVGIGPFIPHEDTPFHDKTAGSLTLTLTLLATVRLLLPNVLLPATTALGTIHPKGREMGILAGANVVMPNLSPLDVRKKYSLYNGKICTGEEAAECVECLRKRVSSTGCELVIDRGDFNGKFILPYNF